MVKKAPVVSKQTAVLFSGSKEEFPVVVTFPLDWELLPHERMPGQPADVDTVRFGTKKKAPRSYNKGDEISTQIVVVGFNRRGNRGLSFEPAYTTKDVIPNIPSRARSMVGVKKLFFTADLKNTVVAVNLG